MAGEDFRMAGEDFPMAGEDFGQPASPQPIEIHWIFLIFLILAVGRPEAWRYGIRWFSMKIRRKNAGNHEKTPGM